MKWLTKQPEYPLFGISWPVRWGITIGLLESTLGSNLIVRKLKQMRWSISSFSQRLFAAIAHDNFHQDTRLRIEIMSEDIVDPFVRHALKNLLKPTGHFSICDFDDICKLLNVIPPPGHRDRLSLMHCVNYRDMSLGLRHEVGRLVYETLNTAGFDIEIKPERLLGKSNVRSITGRSDGDKS